MCSKTDMYLLVTLHMMEEMSNLLYICDRGFVNKHVKDKRDRLIKGVI